MAIVEKKKLVTITTFFSVCDVPRHWATYCIPMISFHPHSNPVR